MIFCSSGISRDSFTENAADLTQWHLQRCLQVPSSLLHAGAVPRVLPWCPLHCKDLEKLQDQSVALHLEDLVAAFGELDLPLQVDQF